jgi:hypothetical protein
MTSVISTASGINSTSNISNFGNEVAVKVAVRVSLINLKFENFNEKIKLNLYFGKTNKS